MTTNRHAPRQHPAALRVIGDRLVFGRELHHLDATAFRRHMHQAQREGRTGFTFDFGATEFAAPVAMAQMVVQAEACRNAGMHFDVIDPKDPKTRAMFQHSNWAHHLSPINYEPHTARPEHWLPVVRYRTDNELRSLVDHTCDVVLREADVRRSALYGLEWALNEMADNVFQHAEAPEGGLVAVTVAAKRRRVQFVVADAGRGIPATIRTGHSGLGTDLQAIKHAVKQGVTRSRDVGAGNGLAGALRIATAAGGSCIVHSGRALVEANAKHRAPRGKTYSSLSALDGTVIYFEIAVNRDFDLESALLDDGIGIADWDYIESTYAPDDRDVRLRVTDEVTSTATRIAGMPLRRKSSNLVYAHPTAKIALDFSDVSRITASFADEVVGKLLVSLGPAKFKARIALDGLDDALVRGQIARALTQRGKEARAAERRRRQTRRRRHRNHRQKGS